MSRAAYSDRFGALGGTSPGVWTRATASADGRDGQALPRWAGGEVSADAWFVGWPAPEHRDLPLGSAPSGEATK